MIYEKKWGKTRRKPLAKCRSSFVLPRSSSWVIIHSAKPMIKILYLQWKCVNFKRGIIRADKQLSWKRKDDEDRELVSTKNSKAREITPPAAVVDGIIRWVWFLLMNWADACLKQRSSIVIKECVKRLGWTGIFMMRDTRLRPRGYSCINLHEIQRVRNC